MYYTESRGKEKDIAENQTGFYIIILIPIDIETVRFTTTPVYEYCHSSSLRYIYYVGRYYSRQLYYTRYKIMYFVGYLPIISRKEEFQYRTQLKSKSQWRRVSLSNIAGGSQCLFSVSVLCIIVVIRYRVFNLIKQQTSST